MTNVAVGLIAMLAIAIGIRPSWELVGALGAVVGALGLALWDDRSKRALAHNEARLAALESKQALAIDATIKVLEVIRDDVVLLKTRQR